MMQERLFKMVHILINRKKVTAKELALELEVSMRTIYRDLDSLTLAGIPVYTNKGLGGGIHIDPDYLISKSVLSNREQDEIMLGLKILQATKMVDTSSSIEKMQALFHSVKNEDVIQIDFNNWGDSGELKQRFYFIKDSIMNSQCIHFQYIGNDQILKQRFVEPHTLLLKGNVWYLRAYCLDKNNFRTFRLSRMRHVNLSDELFERKEFVEEKHDVFKGTTLLHLKFDSIMWYRLIDEFALEDIVTVEDGYEVKVYWPLDEWIIGFLLSFQDHVKVIEPRSIRDQLKLRISKMNKIYV